MAQPWSLHAASRPARGVCRCHHGQQGDIRVGRAGWEREQRPGRGWEAKHAHRRYCDHPPQRGSQQLSTGLSDAVVEGAARAGGRAASRAPLSNLIPWRQLASAGPVASSVASASQGALVAAIFAPRLEPCGTFFCMGAPRANVPDPLFKFFSAWSEWKRPFKCSKCPRGIITPSKEKGCVIHAILLVLMTLHAQRG